VRAWWLLVLALSGIQDASRPAFSDWLNDIRAEALARGIRQEILDRALGDLTEPVAVVLERDRAQAEVLLPLERYITRRLTPSLIRTGRERFASQRTLLDEVGDRYGVPARILAGIWGIESNFGKFSGVRPTIAALATLAWDPRRATFFRSELFDALEILNRGDIDVADMRGSWAGAMGQAQFMPSSYLRFAEDFDGDGRKDIWSSSGDVLASIANYLKGHGWAKGQSWGREVAISPAALARIRRDVARRDGACRAKRDMTIAVPLKRWSALGVKLPGGKPLPSADLDASLVSGSKRYFLVYGNYDALLEYNCAHSYALSVALLGDAVALPALAATPAASEKAHPVKRAARKSPAR